MTSTKAFDREQFQAFLTEQTLALETQLSHYPWPWETERWHELVFCVVLRNGQPTIEPDKARRVVTLLADLDLLEIERLSSSLDQAGRMKIEDVDTALVQTLLQRMGFGEEQATKIVMTLCRIAASLKRRYDGKIQKYLRAYGERMLEEVDSQFDLPDLSKTDKRYIFGLWLQNALSMPVLLDEPALRDVCEAFGGTLDDIAEVADDLDLYLGLLDDMAAEARVERVDLED